jgi:uncharacterized repeat protein (TIGR02543 family)
MRVLDLIKTLAIAGILLFVGCSDNGGSGYTQGSQNGGGDDGGNPVSYTITFDSRGGTGVSSITKTSGTVIPLPSPSRNGYTFKGWYSASSGGVKYISPYTVTGNLTMYAQWAQDNVGNISGGEEGETREINGIEFVFVKGGTFMMGSPEDEEGRNSDFFKPMQSQNAE